jgi:alkanesulfonate monooxygenase SsuD/methylene tetrahydromethanopterin reductase-like flavin-dependent oxidoreductase (luciferase family)
MVDDAPIPLEAVPAIRAAVRDPLLLIAGPIDVAVIAARTADAWHVWHQSTQHRADVGGLLPRLIADARIAARAAGGHDRRARSSSGLRRGDPYLQAGEETPLHLLWNVSAK